MEEITKSMVLLTAGAVVGYLFKREELLFSKIKDNKINSIKDFLKAYQTLSIAVLWYHGEAFTNGVRDNEEKLRTLSKKILDARIEFNLQVLVVKLFLSKKDQTLVDRISDTLEQSRVAVDFWLIRMRSKSLDNAKDDKFNKVEDTILNQLPVKVEELASNLREDFGVDKSKLFRRIGVVVVCLIVIFFIIVFK